MTDERAQLGIDGNCAFALVGEDPQEGEAEFVKIEEPGDANAKVAAADAALKKLRERLGKPGLDYYYGPSHPLGHYFQQK